MSYQGGQVGYVEFRQDGNIYTSDGSGFSRTVTILENNKVNGTFSDDLLSQTGTPMSITEGKFIDLPYVR